MMIKTPPREQQSIFGPTYQGVPNPLTCVRHGYPTRFHGPIWIHPRAGYRYIQSPFRGTGQLDPEQVEQLDKACAFCWPTRGTGDSITGSRVFDALLGAVAGLAVANKKHWQYYMGAGAIGALVLGWPALAATTGVALVQREELFKEMLG